MHAGHAARARWGWLARWAAALAVCAGKAFPAPVQEASPNRVDYTIEVRVDTDTMRLTGRERVSFANRTDTPTSELWFHLYWNAFSNNASTHLTESRGELKGVKIEDGWGWQRVTSVEVGGVDRLATLRFEQPDDGNAEDRTVFKLSLDAPIEPGATIECDLAWEAQIPRVRRRTGYKGDFLFIAQWFPKLGVFEGAKGWNCRQFHDSTEFFSDYGVYDVSIDLPAAYEDRIGASGVRVDSPRRLGDRVVTHFVAPDPADQTRPDVSGRKPLVHDFVWTADPTYKRFVGTFHYDTWRERFDTEAAAVSRVFSSDKNLRSRNVEVVVLIHAERERQWQRHFEATCAALFFYGLWFGEYPYGQITCVDPAWGAGAAGGMEYPMLFGAGSRMWNDPQMHAPEGVTVHEAGHQFFHGLVGNNEFESAWMDEGFNSFADAEALFRAWGRERETTEYSGVPCFGAASVSLPGAGAIDGFLSARNVRIPLLDLNLTPLRDSGFVNWWRDQPKLAFADAWTDPRWHDRVRYLADPDRDTVDTPSFRYVDRRSYATNSYPRAAVALRSLIGVIGRDAFLKGMREYSEHWRFRHPSPQDFFDAFCKGAGVDVQWYFDDAFRSRKTVDWSVEVEQRRRPALKGWTQSAPTGEFVESVKADGETANDAPWQSEVLVTRRGELRLPLSIELRFEGGAQERVSWSREDQEQSAWLRIRREGPNKIVGALVDPERLYYFDGDMTNNQWFDVVDEVAPWRWTERAFQRFSSFLFWQAGIGG